MSADLPLLRPYRKDGRLLADCPHCDQAGRVTLKRDGTGLFDCFAKCSDGSGTYRVQQDGSGPDTAGAPTTQADELAGILNLGEVGLSITGARIVGRGAAASADLYLSDGTTITFETLKDFTTPVRLALQVTACTGAKCPVLKVPEALGALVLLRQIAEHVQSTTNDDIAIDWGLSYLEGVEVISLDMTDRRERWGAFKLLEQRWAGTVLEHTDGTRYVRSGWFFDHVRLLDHAAGSRAVIAVRMERVGWVRRGKTGRIKATSLSFPGQLVWSFFEVPAGWETTQAGDE